MKTEGVGAMISQFPKGFDDSFLSSGSEVGF